VKESSYEFAVSKSHIIKEICGVCKFTVQRFSSKIGKKNINDFLIMTKVLKRVSISFAKSPTNSQNQNVDIIGTLFREE
jgi:hypothetical protein